MLTFDGQLVCPVAERQEDNLTHPTTCRSRAPCGASRAMSALPATRCAAASTINGRTWDTPFCQAAAWAAPPSRLVTPFPTFQLPSSSCRELLRCVHSDAMLSSRFPVETHDVVSRAPTGRFDVAVSRHCIQVLGRDAARRALANIAKALRPGDAIIIVGSGTCRRPINGA